MGMQLPWQGQSEVEGANNAAPSASQHKRPAEEKEENDYVSVQNQGEYV